MSESDLFAISGMSRSKINTVLAIAAILAATAYCVSVAHELIRYEVIKERSDSRGNEILIFNKLRGETCRVKIPYQKELSGEVRCL